MTQVDASMVTINDAMRVVELYQNHQRIREANSRLVGFQLNEKVMYWSLGQSIIVPLVAILQVCLLRRFLDDKK